MNTCADDTWQNEIETQNNANVMDTQLLCNTNIFIQI